VLLSPLFLLFLAVLLVVRSKFQRTHYSVEEPLKQV
jgi:hypothetical protein